MNVPLTPLRCLERALDLFPHHTGVVCGDQVFTYREFGNRCARLAGVLLGLGVQPGERVAYLSFNTHKLLEGYFGPLQAGAIVMPLNVRLSEGEFASILNHSQAGLVFFEDEFSRIVDALRPACPAVRQWLSVDDVSYERMLAAADPAPLDVSSVDEDSVAEIFYTSGSTGQPKGVCLTHRNLYLHALEVAIRTVQKQGSTDLHTIPLFHANGWGRPQIATMLGCKQVMVRRFDPQLVFSLIERHRANTMSLVPTMANMLLNAPGAGECDLSSLREIMLGGAAASPELIARLEETFHCNVIAGYGLSETSPVLTTGHLKPGLPPMSDGERRHRQSMAGWPIPGVRLRVVDLHGNEAPRDMTAIGEIVVQGDVVMHSYYKDPDGTAAVMRGGWFHTGDMAVWDEEGYVHIVDRKKEIIISGGENISSLEVERAIAAHPAVFECAVIAAPDEHWGEVPAAIVSLKEGSTLTEEDLLQFLSARLGRYKVPRHVEFTHEPLPKTGTGKVRKLLLRERFWSDKPKRVQG